MPFDTPFDPTQISGLLGPESLMNVPPALGSLAVQNPEAFAAAAARAGIPPQAIAAAAPPTPTVPQPPMPGAGASPFEPMTPAAPPQGPTLQNPGQPLDIRPPAQAAGAQPDLSQRLTSTLRGVQAPTVPQEPRVGTPSAPGLGARVQNPNVLQILNALMASAHRQQPAGTTLGAALHGR